MKHICRLSYGVEAEKYDKISYKTFQLGSGNHLKIAVALRQNDSMFGTVTLG